MRLKHLRIMTVLIVLSGCTQLSASAQDGDNKPLTDLPRQFAATAFGQADTMAGKSFWDEHLYPGMVLRRTGTGLR